MSSTALVLTSLGERGEVSSAHGRQTFAVLLFQDLVVIPMLALLPLLAGEAPHQAGGNLLLAAKGLLAIVVVIAGGRLVVGPALKLIATHGSREAFTAAALLVMAVTVSMLFASPLFALHRRVTEAWRARTEPPEFDTMPILARARNRVHWFRLRDLGVEAIYRETFASSLEVAHQSLLRLGMSAALAEHAIGLFRRHDEAQLRAQYAVRQDEEQLMQTTRQAAEQLKELFEADAAHAPVAWTGARSVSQTGGRSVD